MMMVSSVDIVREADAAVAAGFQLRLDTSAVAGAARQAEAREDAVKEPLQDVGVETVTSAAESLDYQAELANFGVRFRVEEEADVMVAQIVDKETQEVIRQIPPEELIALSKRMADFIGLLFDAQV